MVVRLAAFFISVILFSTVSAQQALQTPEQFLGYALGAKYTRHYQIVGYFEQVAKANPSKVKVQQYGFTNEGRPLMVAFISSPENISNLEQIRLNNLRLAGLAKDKVAPVETMPAIVWLSYNVHGNEPSSSEAAMKTLYSLLDPANTQSAAWLKNTVVVLDPCINPDGRDRYANWQNSVTNLTPDANAQTREHREPWPGGRVNHYYFDLNRDWAWQTQVESRQRMELYNQWLPQVHVDFHEQGFNSPYYFAPAAEPYHEVVTPWQREFQLLIGKNHAKYFDSKGWLYFTKQTFDLFYPSYGDTYPTYNGGIGMTYEQGGGPGGGKAVRTEDGDTLRLADRIEHHYTTGMSTIEVTSVNGQRLIKEFRKFFTDGSNGTSGEYKTYIIRHTASMGAEAGDLGRYLLNNGIEYGYAGSKATTKGYNFTSRKEETFNVNPNDIVVSAYQPKSAMVKVLFEPDSKLVDSNTYDITSWSLPYALGLEAYGVKEKILPSPASADQLKKAESSETVKEAYAWVIPWNGSGSAVLLAQLLKAGIRVRYAEREFQMGGKTFEKGSLIVTRAANSAQGDQLYAAIKKALVNSPGFHETIAPIQSGFVDKGFDLGSNMVRFIKAPKVALMMGEGVGANAVGELWHYFEQELKYPVSVINTTDLGQTNLSAFDVLIMADGRYRFFGDKAITDDLKRFVQQGGKLIALENAVSQLSSLEWTIRKKKEETKKVDEDKTDYTVLKKYGTRDRDNLVNSIPGAIYKVELDPTHPLAFGYKGNYLTLKMDDNIYEFIKEDGWNVGVIRKDNYVNGFAGSGTKQKLKDGLLIGVQDLGRGNIVYFADDLIFRGFWENGKLMLANAVFLVGE